MEIRKYDLPTDRLTWVGARDACASKNVNNSTRAQFKTRTTQDIKFVQVTDQSSSSQNQAIVNVALGKTKNGENLNNCRQCDNASSDASHFMIHIITHSGEKMNKCNQCDYVSSKAGNLRRHLKRHTGKSQTNATNVILHHLRRAI